MNYQFAYRARDLAPKEIFGKEESSYMELLWYKDGLKKTNPGSHIVLEVDRDTMMFQRLFIAFEACIKGEAYCRLMVFLDATFLKTKFGGCLMGATFKNGNQVVGSEDDDNWL
ncbi:hypothetical protein BVC80_9049g61 [Macleaya cordata]|uniref:Protein FAR1-RELATED SEQUENCE n=1 Tax=Macleaya cordata TaxID=56857 RepID=A0A200R2M3_MACCD|nr:hypothetical protein BVC80_9049g61 [Macleaya cordata]